jgi:hypothetical protein
VAAGLVAGVLLLLATMIGIDLLRLAEGPVDPTLTLESGDPRVDVVCPGADPAEGTPRDVPVEPAERPEVEVTSGELLDCPQAFDGRRVIYEGEVVGQRLGRGERVWIQVNDDAYGLELGPLPGHRYYLGGNSGLGVNLAVDDDARIGRRGGPGVLGDRVEIHGTFHRVDERSGEMAVIRATSLEVIGTGRDLDTRRHVGRQVVAYALLLVAGILMALQRRRSRF